MNYFIKIHYALHTISIIEYRNISLQMYSWKITLKLYVKLIALISKLLSDFEDALTTLMVDSQLEMDL